MKTHLQAAANLETKKIYLLKTHLQAAANLEIKTKQVVSFVCHIWPRKMLSIHAVCHKSLGQFLSKLPFRLSNLVEKNVGYPRGLPQKFGIKINKIVFSAYQIQSRKMLAIHAVCHKSLGQLQSKLLSPLIKIGREKCWISTRFATKVWDRIKANCLLSLPNLVEKDAVCSRSGCKILSKHTEQTKEMRIENNIIVNDFKSDCPSQRPQRTDLLRMDI